MAALAGGAHAQEGPNLYVPLAFSDLLSIINTATGAVAGAPIPVGLTPSAVAVRGDQAFAYVANYNDYTVSVVDTGTNTVIDTIAVGAQPVGIALTPDGTRAYVANRIDGTASIIDTATKRVIGTVAVGANPYGVAITPDGTRAYVANSGGNSLSVIDTATNTVVGNVSVPVGPRSVAITPDGTKAYVSGTGSVTVVDIGTGSVLTTIAAAGGNGLNAVAISPDGTRAYAASTNDDTVTVIDTATNTVTTTISGGGGGPVGVVFSPDGTRVYVTSFANGNVLVIDPATNTVIDTIAVGVFQYFPGICSNGNALLAAGRTFVAKSAGALGCTGASGAVFTGGTLEVAAASITSAVAVTLGAGGGTINTNGNTLTLSGALTGTGPLTKTGAGTLVVSGTNTYTGNTTVNGGALIVNGSIANSAMTTVNAGATLGGSGTVGHTTINGGTLSPGNSIGTITVQGNLAFTTAATYLVELSPAASDRTNVTGTATLAGTVRAQFAPGSYVQRSYTILNAQGGRTGTFGALTTEGLPAGFTAELGYTSTDVLLNLTAVLGALPGNGLNANQSSVAAALNAYFNNGGALPPAFVGVFRLTGVNLANGLSQLSGEAGTGAQQAAFQSMQSFINLMLDPFVAGRGGSAGGALPFAGAASAQAGVMPDEIGLAYAKAMPGAMPVKAPPPAYAPRWSVWGSAYGGTGTIDGEPAVGSATTDSRIGGFAAGADYRISPNAVLGFALAGGGTSWSLTNGLGSGRSDVFQAGAYGAARFGATYLSAALAYAWHDATITRTVTIGAETLEGHVRPQAFGGRIEGGRRLDWGTFGVTPYAAAQVLAFDARGYTETATAGAGAFGLSYAGANVTAPRTELGLWADHRQWLDPDTELVLRGRAAWAHDYDTDRRLNAAFQGLPGASFIVNGAAPSPDLALLSAVGELRMRNGVSLTAKFDGELGERSETYAATGTLRYAW